MDPDISFKETKSLFCLFVVMSICLDHERSSAMVTIMFIFDRASKFRKKENKVF